MKTTIGVVLLFWVSSVCVAGSVTVEGARLWAAPDQTRVVFDISAPVQHSVFTLRNPDRLVIDLTDAKLAGRLKNLDFTKGLVKDIRSAPRDGHDLRVVLDLKAAVQPKSFVLKPNRKYGNRLVIDLEPKQARRAPVKTAKADKSKARDVVIAIDAGHGGEDPGATGPRGTHEKDVVLAIARRLEALVQKTPGIRPLMIRDGDYYVGLRKRIQIARKNKADIFISIHADASRSRRAHGATVYALSQHGASSEAARLLAERENASDFVGGVSLGDKDDLLAKVLVDLSQTGTIEASLELGKDVLSQLEEVGAVHKRRVNQAGFVVLKSPDIPSILVETAYISNPRGERRLRSARYQQKLARSIMRGVDVYLAQNPPPGTLLALHRRNRRHIIVRGDTLSGLAQRYDISVDQLRTANGLDDDILHPGDVLKIPSDSNS
jgi:N-acetylmuramoyl-L-alanine amidase